MSKVSDFKFISQITDFNFVSFRKLWVPVTNQRDKVQRLNDDIKTTEARLSGDTERELWDVEKWYVRAIKTFGAGNFPSIVCYVSSNSFLRFLAEDATYICFIAATFLFK